MQVSLNTRRFEKQLNNIVQYSMGFLDGAQKGKKIFLSTLGKSVIEILGKYIDMEARANQSAMHHVYEWYQTGSPKARLFDLKYIVYNNGLSINATFTQSRTLAEDSNVPFYNKASIMERGIPVRIVPKKSVLAFTAGGETVFTKQPVDVRNPGGTEVVGSFERVIDEFFRVYFTQAFLKSSGLFNYISKPKIYKKNFAAGAKIGRSKGIETGFAWIANAKIEVE